MEDFVIDSYQDLAGDAALAPIDDCNSCGACCDVAELD